MCVCGFAFNRLHMFSGAALRDRLACGRPARKLIRRLEDAESRRDFCIFPNPPPTYTDETAYAVTFLSFFFFFSGSQPPPNNVQQAVSSHMIIIFNEPVYAEKSPLAAEARPARRAGERVVSLEVGDFGSRSDNKRTWTC